MTRVTRSMSPAGIEAVVRSGPRICIDTISEFIHLLRQEMAEAETVRLAFDPEVEMDLTALQALCSAYTTALAAGKKFSRIGPPPQTMLELVAAAGLQCRERCTKSNDLCFFTSGRNDVWQS